jgi:hypothetical protein
MLRGLEVQLLLLHSQAKHLQKQIIVAKTRSVIFEHEGTLALLGRTLPAERYQPSPGLCLMVLVVRPNVVVNHRSESIGLMPPYDASDIATYQPSQAWQTLQYTVYYLIVGNFAYTYSLYR